MNEHHRLKGTAAVIVSGAILVGETLPARKHWIAIEGRSTPTEHVPQEIADEGVIRLAVAAAGPNVVSHSITSSAMLSFESTRRVELPFIVSGDFDYAILQANTRLQGKKLSAALGKKVPEDNSENESNQDL